MDPHPRIHKSPVPPNLTTDSSIPTITQSTALWKALKHREELDAKEKVDGRATRRGLLQKVRHALHLG